MKLFWAILMRPSCWFRRHAWVQRTERDVADHYAHGLPVRRDLRWTVTEDDRFCERCGAFSA